MPLPLLLGAAALAPAIGSGIGAAIGGQTKIARENRQQLLDQARLLREGKLGYTEGQKRQMLSTAMQASQAQTRARESGLRQEAAAIGGFGRSGAQAAERGALAAAEQGGVAQSLGGIEAASQQQATAREAAVRQALQTQALANIQRGQQIGGQAGAGAKEALALQAPAGPGVDYTGQALSILGLAKA